MTSSATWNGNTKEPTRLISKPTAILRNILLSLIAPLLLVWLLAGTGHRPGTGAPYHQQKPAKSIAELVETTPRLTVFNRVLEASGMKDSLRGGGPYTIFLPVNEAFYNMPYKERRTLWDATNRSQIRRILNNHIVDRKFTVEEMAKRSNLPGRLEDLPVDTTGELLQIKGAHIIQADVQATNGIVHVVDRLIMPSYMEEK